MNVWKIIEIVVLVILIVITSVAYVKARKQAYLAAKAQDEAKKNEQNEVSKVILTVKIDGMMCEKCAQRVSDGLAKYGEIAINLEEKTATVTADELPDIEEIKKDVEQLGYTFVGIE